MTDASRGDDGGTPLDRLCRHLGVERGYDDVSGERREAPTWAVRSALRELGAPVSPDGGEEDDELVDALRALRLTRWERGVEPVTVLESGSDAALELRLPAADAGRALELRVTLEGGGVASRPVEPDELERLEERRVEGRDFARLRVPLPRLPQGVHEVEVSAGAVRATTRAIRAPATSWDGPAEERAGDPGGEGEGAERWRAWGAFLPLHALRTARDRGVGDVADLEALCGWVHERGGGFVGTLPLLPTFLHPSGSLPVDPSPYAPVSRLFWNELHLDLETAPGLAEAPEARRVLESAAHREDAARLRSADRVDHVAVMAHLRRVLGPLARTVAAGPDGEPTLAGPLADFAAERPEALEYARFRARGEAEGAPWPGWEDGAAAGRLGPGDAPAEGVAYHLYAQWAMAEQMERLGDGEGAGLYLDLPLGCHRAGYDVWRHRRAFATGASGGAPPDAFFAGGQDWGFPPLHPRRSRDDGHAYLRASLAHLMGACRMLRLDHVMSLHRLFWVPEGGTPADGVYVRYPADELWALLCLESRRHRCEVVGEDLGTVPPEVPRAMRERRARRMWVLPFEVGPWTEEGGGDRPAAPEPPRRSAACLDTHDMPPFAAFWEGLDVAWRVEEEQLDPDHADAEAEERRRWRRSVCRQLGLDEEADAGEALPAALDHLARSPARLALVNLEDLWLEERPQNRPGTTGPWNWSLRAARTLEEMREDPRVRTLLERVDRGRRDASAADTTQGPTTDDEP